MIYLHEEDGLLFFSNRMIITESMKKDILDRLHDSHLGMEKSKARARETFYWSNMSGDIEERIKQCETGARHRTQNEKEPMIGHEQPILPSVKVGADSFEYGGHDYQLVIDHYSKYPEIARLDSKTAQSVIKTMKQIFSRHSMP